MEVWGKHSDKRQNLGNFEELLRTNQLRNNFVKLIPVLQTKKFAVNYLTFTAIAGSND